MFLYFYEQCFLFFCLFFWGGAGEKRGKTTSNNLFHFLCVTLMDTHSARPAGFQSCVGSVEGGATPGSPASCHLDSCQGTGRSVWRPLHCQRSDWRPVRSAQCPRRVLVVGGPQSDRKPPVCRVPPPLRPHDLQRKWEWLQGGEHGPIKVLINHNPQSHLI